MSVPKYEEIKNKIKRAIRQGIIVDKLPGERVLAKDYGVSYMTVRKAVMELVEEGLLYKLATKGTFVSDRRISPKVTKNIGFFLDSEIREGISSPYYSLVFKSFENEVKSKGYSLTMFSDLDDLNPLNNQKKIDGVVICYFPRLEKKVQEIKKLLPTILIDNLSSDKSIPSVTIDNYNSCRDAANYLISLGHERIGFISGLLDSDVCLDRYKGYTSALADHAIKEEKKLVYKGDYSYESGEKGGKHFLNLSKPPTAIMCANDSMAIGAMKVVREKGLQIPENISVVGFDDIDVASRVFPPLTTVAAPMQQLAEKTIDLLVSAINGEDTDYHHVILPAKLIVRDSCSSALKNSRKIIQ